LEESQAAWDQTAQSQRDSAEALRSQADSLLLASYLQAVSAMLDASTKARQQKSVDVEQLDAVIQALQPQVDAIVGKETETPAETDVAAESLEQAVRDFRGVLEANPLRPGGGEAAEAVQAALRRLKDELLAVASDIEDSPYLEHAIGHAEELLEKSVPTDEAMPEAENRLARYETAIIQMCSEVQRAAQDHRRQSPRSP
jgi:predicted Zn-dependent protease